MEFALSTYSVTWLSEIVTENDPNFVWFIKVSKVNIMKEF